MQPEDFLHAVEHAQIHQLLRATRRHLFRMLENKAHRAMQHRLALSQHFCRPEQHRGMSVMTAGVHHAGHRRAKRFVVLLLDG
ncbi:hypothetical protein D3C86_1748360 [compost metagenome]